MFCVLVLLRDDGTHIFIGMAASEGVISGADRSKVSD